MNTDIVGGVRTWFRHAWIVLAVAAVIIALDQWTKELVRESIPIYGSTYPIPALGDYFYFQHVYNYGAAFGILQAGGNFFIVVAAIVSVAMLVYVRFLDLDQRFVRIMLGLQMGGAIGNVIDRINQGYVTDFVKMGIPDVYYWPTYNVADAAIVTGVIGLGIYIVREDIRRQRAEQATAGDSGGSEVQSPHDSSAGSRSQSSEAGTFEKG